MAKKLTIQITDLKKGFHAFGNKGHHWGDQLHIAKSGFDPDTLCGLPMLSHNYAHGPLDGVTCTHIKCQDCITEYNKLNQKPEVKDIFPDINQN